MSLGCPRSHAIANTESYYADPLTYNASSTGTAWHAWVAGDLEKNANAEVNLRGVINGVDLTGQSDRLTFDLKLIEDWKHKNDFGIKYVKKEGATLEHQVQLALYSELCEQTLGWRPTRGCIWYHSSVGGKDAMLPMMVEIMPLEKALGVKPHHGTYTVGELLIQAAKPQSMWESLPLAGESQSFGDKTACNYCSVRSICWTKDRNAPF